ncbi:hypothetical protein D3C71_1742550 [compost metagenome]
MSRYSASCASMCAGSHFRSCATLPWIAATLSGSPAGWVQAWCFSARPSTQGASNSRQPMARNEVRERRRYRLHSSAAVNARVNDTSHTPPSGARPASGPSSWL